MESRPKQERQEMLEDLLLMIDDSETEFIKKVSDELALLVKTEGESKQPSKRKRQRPKRSRLRSAESLDYLRYQ